MRNPIATKLIVTNFIVLSALIVVTNLIVVRNLVVVTNPVVTTLISFLPKVMVNAYAAILVDELFPGITGLLLSTAMIFLLGEIIPQVKRVQE